MQRTTAQPLPHPIAPLAFAVVSAIVFLFSTTSGNSGSGVRTGLVFFGAIGAVVLSVRYTLRTYRRLAAVEFQTAHMLRWGMLVLAMVINGFVGMIVAGFSLLIIGTLLTGGAPVG